MLVKNVFRQNSFYTALYQMIPDNHILKQIDSAIDLSFVNDLLADRYLSMSVLGNISTAFLALSVDANISTNRTVYEKGTLTRSALNHKH